MKTVKSCTEEAQLAASALLKGAELDAVYLLKSMAALQFNTNSTTHTFSETSLWIALNDRISVHEKNESTECHITFSQFIRLIHENIGGRVSGINLQKDGKIIIKINDIYIQCSPEDEYSVEPWSIQTTFPSTETCKVWILFEQNSGYFIDKNLKTLVSAKHDS